jgi:regulatory protein SWI6
LLKLRITNLRRANEDQKNSILRNGGTVKGAHEVKVGDADAGLDIDLAQLPPLSHDNQLPNLTPQQLSYLATLPSPSILNARISAYSSHNAQLEQEVSRLKNRSVELDRTLKKIVLLDLGLREEEMTEEMWSKVLGAWREDLKEGVTDERVREVLVRVRGVGA